MGIPSSIPSFLAARHWRQTSLDSYQSSSTFSIYSIWKDERQCCEEHKGFCKQSLASSSKMSRSGLDLVTWHSLGRTTHVHCHLESFGEFLKRRCLEGILEWRKHQCSVQEAWVWAQLQQLSDHGPSKEFSWTFVSLSGKWFVNSLQDLIIVSGIEVPKA